MEKQQTLTPVEQQQVIEKFQQRRKLCGFLFIVPPLVTILLRILIREFPSIAPPGAGAKIVVGAAFIWALSWIVVFTYYRCPRCGQIPGSTVIDTFGHRSNRLATNPAYCSNCGTILRAPASPTSPLP